MRHVFRYILVLLLSVVLFVFSGCRTVATPSANQTTASVASPPGTAFMFKEEGVALECFNRSVQEVNGAITKHVLYPLGTTYNVLVPEILRRGISNFGVNTCFPIRLVNNALQGNFAYCWDETKRFGLNTTVGLLGFFDPATSYWDIPLRDADFGLTMGHYGVGEGAVVNLPLMGPTTVRDGLGMFADWPLDIMNWVLHGRNRFAVKATGSFNKAAFNCAFLNQFFNENYDSYPLASMYNVLKRRAMLADIPSTIPDDDPGPDDSFGFLLLKPSSPSIERLARTRHVRLPGAGSDLPYTCWLPKGQPEQIVFILPGVGGHRLDNACLGLAELFLERNCAVISLSSTLSFDYFLHIPGNAPPGFFPQDAKMLAKAIAAVTADSSRKWPQLRNVPLNLIGYSLGGINVLFLASQEQDSGLPPIHRYVSINAPFNAYQSLQIIDNFMDIPHAWPPDEREQHGEQVIFKVLQALVATPNKQQSPSLPLTREESQFLLGLNLRLNLAETIIASQRRHNQGVLRNNPADFCKNQLQKEVLNIGFCEYLRRFVLPYHQAQPGLQGLTEQSMAEQCSLDSLTDSLRDNDRVFVFQNENDFLISSSDAAWYRGTFGQRAIVLPRGGHLGNMAMPEFQQLLCQAMELPPPKQR